MRILTYDDSVAPTYFVAYDAGESTSPPHVADAGYLWVSNFYGYESYENGPTGGVIYWWQEQPKPQVNSNWAINHHLEAVEMKIGAGRAVSQTEMDFLQGNNGYGRGSSIAPSGWLADVAPGNQFAIWNDFVARIQDAESGGDFLGIKGLGTPDDWGPTQLIITAFSAGSSAIAAEAATQASIAAADAAGGLMIEYGTTAAYEISTAAPTSTLITNAADSAAGMSAQYGTTVSYDAAISAPSSLINLEAADIAAGLQPATVTPIDYSQLTAWDFTGPDWIEQVTARNAAYQADVDALNASPEWTPQVRNALDAKYGFEPSQTVADANYGFDPSRSAFEILPDPAPAPLPSTPEQIVTTVDTSYTVDFAPDAPPVSVYEPSPIDVITSQPTLPDIPVDEAIENISRPLVSNPFDDPAALLKYLTPATIKLFTPTPAPAGKPASAPIRPAALVPGGPIVDTGMETAGAGMMALPLALAFAAITIIPRRKGKHAR